MAKPYHRETGLGILRAKEEVIVKMEEGLVKASGRSGVLEKLVEENDRLVRQKMAVLGVGDQPKK